MRPDTERNKVSFEAWLATRPPMIQEMGREYPGWQCYRMKGSRIGHYRIYSYCEDGTFTVEHGRDSFLPGIHVFGCSPYELTVCGCESWLPAEVRQTERVVRYLERERLETN